MNHFVLFLYLLSGFSGISSIIFLIGKYGRNSSKMKGYIRVHLTYTSMMLISLVLLYVRVNVNPGKYLMPLFISCILAGQGFLLYALADFSNVIQNEGKEIRLSIFWKIFPSIYFVLAILQFYLWFTPFTLLPVLTGTPLFIALAIWFSINNHKVDKGDKEDKKWKKWIWIAFMIFTVFIILLEIILKRMTGFLGEYTINIPLIFLAWNLLSLYQFNKEYEMNSKPVVISDQWNLSEREKEIAISVSKGYSNKEIASDLSISASTVKNHIYSIYRKTGVQSRVELVNKLK